tara:strand:- start:1917 stop:2831 length:915 start_codon:yes stop_codon:yes gene_type:complete
MEIAFFTEGGYQGKVPRTHSNMRTELAWMCALNADHWNINQSPNQKYDLGVIIIPKNNPQFDINQLKQYCNKIAVMQEGPNWYWQDYSLPQQIWYFNTIQESDFMFVHNESDKKYYKGLTGKECIVLPSLMIENSVSNLPQIKRKNIIIGGNFCSWYGGFDSYMIAQEANCPIHIPSMGRKIKGEEQMSNLNHLPYMNWVKWIKTLNNFKYGVHLMRTHAAGTFALNCAYLGIPCIGYEGLDTQEKCHPDLTVKLGDLASAKEKLILLKTNNNFYNKCSKVAKENYKKLYKEDKFLKNWSFIIK